MSRALNGKLALAFVCLAFCLDLILGFAAVAFGLGLCMISHLAVIDSDSSRDPVMCFFYSTMSFAVLFECDST
jgi:hypothetical protein